MKIIQLFFVFPWLFLVSCENEITLETIDGLTMQAYLHAGQTIDTVEFYPLIALNASAKTENLSDLLPLIYTQSGQVIELSYISGSEGGYTAPETVVEVGETYTIEVDYKGVLVRAETQVPPAPLQVSISDTVIYRAQISDFSDLSNMEVPDPIEINWEGEEGAFYFAHVQNIEENPEAINLLFEEGNAPPRPDFQTEPSTETYYAIDTFREITHYGWYEVIIYRVNPEYVTLYDDNSSGVGNLNEIRTNVVNGFGIFTGLNSVKIYFQVVKS